MKKLLAVILITLVLAQLTACAESDAPSRTESVLSSMASGVSSSSSEIGNGKKNSPSLAPKKNTAPSTSPVSKEKKAGEVNSHFSQNDGADSKDRSNSENRNSETRPDTETSQSSDFQSESAHTSPTKEPAPKPTVQPQQTVPPVVQPTEPAKPKPTEAPAPEPTQEPVPEPTRKPEPEPSYNWDYSTVISVAMANCSAEWNEKAIESGCTVYTSDSAGSAEDMGMLIAATVNRSGRKYFYVETDGDNWYIYK